MALQLLYLMLLVQGTLAQVPKFSFGAAEYVINESAAPDSTVMLSRDSTITTTASVEIDTTCPTDPTADCAIPSSSNEAEEGANKDYTLTTKTFQFGQTDQSVAITVREDGTEEHKEYFCLRIVDPEQRGTRWFTRVIIPWNDHCVSQFSIFDEGRDKDALGYFIKHDIASVVSHIGPLDVALAPVIKIKVTPQPANDQINTMTGMGNDLNIYVSNRADINSYGDSTGSFQWYGMHLDDTYATGHLPSSGVTDGNSWIDNSGLTREPFAPGVLLGTALTTEMVTQGQNEFILTLTPTGSPISLQKVGGALLEATGGSITGLNNLFVTSANDKYASWEICDLEPRRLPIVSATASGHYQNFEPDLAIDNLIWYTSCFRSELDGNMKQWLQLDMGADFLVKKVVMYPPHFGEDLPLNVMDPRWLNNLGIHVGSCRSDVAFTNNNPCQTDIGMVADTTIPADNANEGQKLIIDVDCAPDAIGRYVYITPQSDSTHIGFCEVRLFGSEVPASSETKVVIASTAQTNEGSVASVTVTQTGSKPTCSYIQYHTDRAPNNDFVEAYPSKEAMIMMSGGNTAITIPTNDDEDCEGDEMFDVYVTGIDGGVLSAASSCRSTVTITDDPNDMISFTLTTPEASVAESVGMVTFTVGHSGMQTQPASASVVFTGGSAVLVKDYTTAVCQDVTFETLPETVSVGIVDDNCYEESETFEVTLADLKPTCSMAPSDIPLTITLTDNDSQFDFSVVGLTDKVLTITEGTTMMLNVQRTGTVQMKTVNYNVTFGAATESDVTITPSSPNTLSFEANVDTAAITIVAEEDGDAEADEVFLLTLEDPNGEGCLNNIGTNNYVIVRIIDNDFMYEFETPSSTNLAEGEQAEVCLSRICSTPTCPTNIPAATVAISGQPITATANDYSIPSPVSIPEGMNRGCVNIQIVSDTTQETAELFNVIIDSGQTGVEGSDSLTFTVFETTGSLRFSPIDYTVTEGESEVTLTVVHTSTANVQFRLFTKDGSAIAGTDYTAVDQTFTLAANTPNMNIPITILNDGNEESSEQFTACIESSSLQVMNAARATVIIDDDDDPVPPPPRPTAIIAFVIPTFRSEPLVFTPALEDRFSPEFLELSFVIVSVYEPFYRANLPGFFRLLVRGFRRGSVIADLEVELERNTPTTGADVVEVTRAETPQSDELTIDVSTLEILAEVCPTGYCNNGTCAANADNDGSVCTCNPNYSGEQCETRSPGGGGVGGGGGSYTTIIIVVNVLLWSLVVILVAACYLVQMRKQKEKKLNEAPAQPIYPNQYNNRGLSSFSPIGNTSWALARQ